LTPASAFLGPGPCASASEQLIQNRHGSLDQRFQAFYAHDVDVLRVGNVSLATMAPLGEYSLVQTGFFVAPCFLKAEFWRARGQFSESGYLDLDIQFRADKIK
jgi:hypothetical protein